MRTEAKFSNELVTHAAARAFGPHLSYCDVNVLVLFFVPPSLSFAFSWPHILKSSSSIPFLSCLHATDDHLNQSTCLSLYFNKIKQNISPLPNETGCNKFTYFLSKMCLSAISYSFQVTAKASINTMWCGVVT